MLAAQLITAVAGAGLPSWTFQRSTRGLLMGLPPSGLCVVTMGHVVRTGGGAGLDLVSRGEAFMVPLAADPEAELDEPVGYAATVASLWAIGEKSLAYVFSKPDLAAGLLELQRGAQLRLDRLTMARARATAPERIADLLHAISDEHGFCPPIRQRDIAALLAMRLETVGRGLRALSSRGVLQSWLSGRNTLAGNACQIDRTKLIAYLLRSGNGDESTSDRS